MRAEVDSDSNGGPTRFHTIASSGASASGSRPHTPLPEDDQAEWAKQEQQVSVSFIRENEIQMTGIHNYR